MTLLTDCPYAGLIHGWAPHYLDHLAPLCSLLQVPLIVTEPKLQNIALEFYPNLAVYYIPPLSLPSALIHAVQLLFVCTPRVLVEEMLFAEQLQQNITIPSIWCPHGNSDKGHALPHMEGLKRETAVLVYGKKMKEFLQEKGILQYMHHVIETSNFRLQYYTLHQPFFDAMIQQKVLNHFPNKQPTLLYAPTWQDAERSSSFYDAAIPLVNNLPNHYNLIILPHPNLLVDDIVLYEQLLHRASFHKNVLVLEHMPTIYPLLSAIDIYIGDHSSIGYDFLFFDRPMFFFNPTRRDPKTDKGLYLHQCGLSLLPDEYSLLYPLINTSQSHLSPIRKQIYDKTFGTEIPSIVWREQILSLCSQLVCV